MEKRISLSVSEVSVLEDAIRDFIYTEKRFVDTYGSCTDCSIKKDIISNLESVLGKLA